MKEISIIGIDTAKNVMQLHGIDKTGKELLKKQVARDKFLTTLSNMPYMTVLSNSIHLR